jgi:3',5'-cyclic-AMP phosphodiesterase
VLPAGRLKDALGIRTVAYRRGTKLLDIKEEKLA